MSGRCGMLVLAVVAAVGLGAPTAMAEAPLAVLSPSVLDELAASVEAEMTSAKVPGLAYVVVQGDRVVDTRVFGHRRAGGSELVDAHTVFEIGSCSKAFTAAMLAMVVEEGKLAWDDRVVDHLPEFRMYDPWVTRELRVADLVCQRSGMPQYALDTMSWMGFDRQDIVRALRFVEPATSFRTTYAYQNNLWLVAAALIEQKSGLSFEDNLDRRIFGPLGMAETTVSPEVLATMPDVATGHLMDDAGEPVPMPADWLYTYWLQIYGPAGSIRSTVTDLAQWLRLHINLGVVDDVSYLKATSVAYLHAPKTLAGSFPLPLADGDFAAYATGWFFQTHQRHPIVWHGGATTSMHSAIGYLPEAGVGLAMLTNAAGNRVPEHAVYKLTELVLGVPAAGLTVPEGAEEHAPVPSRRLLRVVPMGPPLPLERYVGTYTNPAYGTFEVRLAEGHLEMVFGKSRLVGRLVPYSGNTFTFLWPGDPASSSTVTFTVPTGGRAEKLTDPMFKDVQGGEFLRVGSGSGH